jgi:hypothetical protein
MARKFIPARHQFSPRKSQNVTIFLGLSIQHPHQLISSPFTKRLRSARVTFEQAIWCDEQQHFLSFGKWYDDVRMS